MKPLTVREMQGGQTAQNQAVAQNKTITGGSGGGTITPGKVPAQSTSGTLSAGGNLSLGNGPVAAQTPAQALQSAMKATTANQLPTTSVNAPVVLKQPVATEMAVKETAPTTNYDLTEYLRKQSAAKVTAELAGLKGAYEKAMAGYDQEAQRLPQSFDAARNKAAGQNAIATRTFQERAAASGLNSGTGGQAELARSAAYQAALAGIDVNQANADAELERQRADLTATYQSAVAQAEATGDAELASALYQELVRLQGLAREDEKTAYQRALEAKEWDYKLQQDAYQKGQDAKAWDYTLQQDAYKKELEAKEWDYKLQQDADAKALNSATILAEQGKFEALGSYYGWDADTVQFMNEQYQTALYRAALSEAAEEAKTQADNMIKMGLMPDANTLDLAGYSTDYARRLSGAYAAKLMGTARSGSGGSGGSSGRISSGAGAPVGSSLAEAALAWAEQNHGNAEDFVKANYKKYGYSAQSAALADLSMYKAERNAVLAPVYLQDAASEFGKVVTDAVSDAVTKVVGGKDTSYDALKADVIYYLGKGQDAKVGELIARNAGKLTDAQVRELNKIIGK